MRKYGRHQLRFLQSDTTISNNNNDIINIINHHHQQPTTTLIITTKQEYKMHFIVFKTITFLTVAKYVHNSGVAPVKDCARLYLQSAPKRRGKRAREIERER